MFVDCTLKSGEAQCLSDTVGPEDMNPVPVLDKPLVCHLDDALAHIPQAEPVFPSESPTFEFVAFDGIEPFVSLLDRLALKYIEEFCGGVVVPVTLEVIQVLKSFPKAFLEGFVSVSAGRNLLKSAG